MIQKHFWKLAALIAILALVGAIYYAKQFGKEANNGVTIETHLKGNAEAKVELVEYSDFQCPACGQFYPFVKQIMEEKGSEIRFEYRHFPLTTVHPFAVPAAIASESAAQQGKFWEMHDKLFENQAVWSKSKSPNTLFVQYAEEIGLDTAEFKRHLNSSLIADAVDKSFQDARSRGFSGTPTFMLNGEVMKFQTFQEFREQIDAAIAEAK